MMLTLEGFARIEGFVVACWRDEEGRVYWAGMK